MESYWYIIKVMPGKERQMNDQFNQQIEQKKIENIVRFICPTEEEIITIKKKKIIRDKVIYRGYLYFETKHRLEDSQLKKIALIPNIMGLMGDKTPRLMNNVDVKRIIKDEILTNHIELKKMKYLVGGDVTIHNGAFTGFIGTILDIKGEYVDIIVKIFGRDTKVSLTLGQIKK